MRSTALSVKKSSAFQKQASELQAELNHNVTELTNKFRELLNNKRDLETTLPSFDKMAERCQETLARVREGCTSHTR